MFLCPLALTVWPIPRCGLAICLSMVSGGAGLTFYGLSETLYISALVLVWWGTGAAVFINYVIALLQENTESRMMGWLITMYSLAFFASSPIGYLQAGPVTSAFGTQVTLLSSGLVSMVLSGAYVVLLKPVRDLQ